MEPDYSVLNKRQRDALEPLNVSDKIRYLDGEEFKRAEIARILGKRYQHVRNVLIRTTKSGERRKTLSFAADEQVLKNFDSLCKVLGRHADRYLHLILRQGLEELSKLRPNSPETHDFVVEYYIGNELTSDLISVREPDSVKLESSLVKQVHDECQRMRIPVDLFVEAGLEAANEAMNRALEIVKSPFQHCSEMGMEPLQQFLLSDEQVQKMQAWRIDDELLYEAVAEIKGVSINAAARSVANRTRDEKETMKKNPDIRDIMLRLKGSEDKDVDLDDLL